MTNNNQMAFNLSVNDVYSVDWVHSAKYTKDWVSNTKKVLPPPSFIKEIMYYDKESGNFQKEVKYVCPLEKVYNEDGTTRGYRGLFWIELK